MKIQIVNLTVVKFFVNTTQLLLSSGKNYSNELFTCSELTMEYLFFTYNVEVGFSVFKKQKEIK